MNCKEEINFRYKGQYFLEEILGKALSSTTGFSVYVESLDEKNCELFCGMGLMKRKEDVIDKEIRCYILTRAGMKFLHTLKEDGVIV